MKKIILIRHGMTSGNREQRYIGRTDQPLCEEGINALLGKSYPTADILFCSPMKRCLQTADILFPGVEPVIVPDLRECDFGDFEGKNHAELDGGAYYQRWIDSGGTLPFPHGESPEGFKERCVGAFRQCIASADRESLAFVVHGGTVMAIMEAFALPKKAYYAYMVKNGCGYAADFDGVCMKAFAPL